MSQQESEVVVLSDFDGTIVDLDTGALLLERFGDGDWQELDARLEKGVISLEQCLIEQFKMVRASKEDILKMIRSEKIELRPYFVDFVSYCRRRNLHFVIVTGGIDFCIGEILRSKGFDIGTFEMHSGKSECTSQGINIVFPRPTKEKSANFKEDLVAYYHDLGKKVAYIGDGVSDYEPSKVADLVFAVKNSSLSTMCKKNEIEYIEFGDFAVVIESLDRAFEVSLS